MFSEKFFSNSLKCCLTIISHLTSKLLAPWKTWSQQNEEIASKPFNSVFTKTMYLERKTITTETWNHQCFHFPECTCKPVPTFQVWLQNKLLTFTNARFLFFSFRPLAGSVFIISFYIACFNLPQEINKRYVDWMKDVFLICIFVRIQVFIHLQHELAILSRILTVIIFVT